MTRQQAEQFISVYNALLTISTKGEDTKIMAKVLEAIEYLVNTIKIQEDPAPVFEPEVEEEPIMEGE